MDSPALKRIGDLALNKGNVRDGVTLFAWDSVQECDPQTCPVDDKCTCIKGTDKCGVQVQYLEALYGAIFGTYKYLDEPMLFKIGMQIVPLYMTLVKLQMVEMSIRNPIIISAKGVQIAHPIFKEIRETLKTIYTMWKDLDLSISFSAKLNLSGKEGSATPALSGNTGDPERGDPQYYKKLSEGNKSRIGIVR